MKTKIKSTFVFQMNELLKSTSVFLGIICAIFIIAFMLIISSDIPLVELSGFGMIATIYLFVLATTCIRNFYRLGAQVGVSRKTTFLTQILSAVTVSTIISVVSELIISIAQLDPTKSGEKNCFDLYEMIYHMDDSLTFGGHITSILFNICMFICAYFCGVFFALLFWRLTGYRAMIAVVVMIFLVNVLGQLFYYLNQIPAINDFASWFVLSAEKSPLIIMVTLLLITIVEIAIDWLISRKIPIRSAK